MTDIRDQCVAAGVPIFFKQWGGVFKKRNGRLLEGRTWDEMPGGGGPEADATGNDVLTFPVATRQTCPTVVSS